MAMTRMTPCKAKVVPPLEDNIHLPISFNKLLAAADSSSVQVVVAAAAGLEASHSTSQAVAVEPHLQSRGSRSWYYDIVMAVYLLFTGLLLTVCFERLIHLTPKQMTVS
jgi:hypothetical protein